MQNNVTRRSFSRRLAVSAAWAASAAVTVPVTQHPLATAKEPGQTASSSAVDSPGAGAGSSSGSSRNAASYDAIVCGCGAAGLQAALTLTTAGYATLLIEKGPSCAVANGALAGGPALAETSIQAAENETVSVQTLFEHEYDYSHGTVNAALLRRVTAAGQQVVDNFVQNGVPMGLRIDAYGMGFRARHNFTGADGTSVRGLDRFQPLVDAFVAQGGTFEVNRAAHTLLTGADGSVTGVTARCMDTGEEQSYTARAVLVATGGYAGNAERLKQHFGDIEIYSLCNTLSTGEGLDMILAAGGVEDRNWALCCNEFGGANSKIPDAPASAMARANAAQRFAIYGGLIVDPNGDRFMNEQWLSDRPLAQGGEMSLRVARYYAVADQTMVDTVASQGIYAYYGNPEDWYVGATGFAQEVLDALPEDIDKAIQQGWCFKGNAADAAEYFGLTNLEATVKAYSEMAAEGSDSLFYKSPYLLRELTGDTLYVFEYQPSIWTTFGGAKSDAYGRCITAQQEVIPGLYVAGVDNGSLYTSPYYDNEGASLGIAYGSGIVVAQTMVDDLGK